MEVNALLESCDSINRMFYATLIHTGSITMYFCKTLLPVCYRHYSLFKQYLYMLPSGVPLS